MVMELNKVYNMDCLYGLQQLENESVDMIVTSPPYFNLRDYGTVGEIGSEISIDEYLDNLMLIFNECNRVLKDTGSCWVNIDDVYNEQSLMCIPDRFKLKMVESGWICRNEIIWHKPNAMPSSAKSRFNNDYEKFYFFVKQPDYYFETQYEPLKSVISRSTEGGGKNSKYGSIEQETSVRQGLNRSRGTQFVALRKNLPTQEYFVTFLRNHTNAKLLSKTCNIKLSKVEHWFRLDNSGFAMPSVEDWNKVRNVLNDGSETFKTIDHQLTDITMETDDVNKNICKGRIQRAVWSINTKPFKGGHFASYPENLVEIPIKACCPLGGVVLDPFMGSGTTGVVALKQDKNFIGFELSKDYCNLANDRISVTKIEKRSKLW